MWRLIALYASLHATTGVAATCVFVEGASFAKTSFVEAPRVGDVRPDLYTRLLHRSHEIESGQEVALIVREYDYNRQASDSGRYFKITVVIPGPLAEKEVKIDLSTQNLRLSRGGADWVHHGLGDYSEKVSGTMRIRQDDPSLVVASIDAKIEMRLAEDSTPAPMMRLNAEYRFKSRRLEELTPWLGKIVMLPQDLRQAWKPHSGAELADSLGQKCR